MIRSFIIRYFKHCRDGEERAEHAQTEGWDVNET